MMKNVTHKAWRSGKKVLAAISVLAIMMITLPLSFHTDAETVSETDVPAFCAVTYDTSARLQIPAIADAKSYRVYLSPDDDTDLASLTADAAAKCVFSCNTYQSYAYVLNGDTDALVSANTISILPNTAYYFYLVTNDGSADTLQSVYESGTKTAADCYWTNAGHYDISWYTANPGSDTYSIGTEAQLAGLAVLNNGLNGVSPVDFSGKTITIAESLDLSAWLWTPIGTESKPFKGNVSGIVYEPGSGAMASCSHTITGLHTNTYADYQGLFGCVGGNSTIAAIGIADSSIRGQFYIGGVVGSFSGAKMQNCRFSSSANGNAEVGGVVGFTMGTIQDCYNTGKISGTYDVGGIAGCSGQTILGCHNTGSIDGYQNIGGIVGMIRFSPTRLYACCNTGTVSGSYMEAGGIAGYSELCSIDSCYNSGSVYSANYVAGIAGAFFDTGYSLTNSYNTGSISGGYRIGGICGTFSGDSIDNCYNAGSVSNDQIAGWYLGGIVAIVQDGAVSNCYYNKTVLSTDNGYGTGKTTDEMKTQADTLGSAFVCAPSFYADGGVFSAGNPVNGGYPVLTAFGYTGGSDIDSQFDKESDTGCYLVKNAYQLDLMRNYSGSGNSGMVFKLAGNIDLSKAAYNNADKSWQPVGSDSSPFYGTFSGGGYGVSGITISGWNFYQGLFGYTSGTIKNLAVTDVNITGLGHEGAVAGYNTGVISHCSATGTVGGILLGDNIGGIVGNSEGADSTVSGCCSACAVFGDGWIGGVVGYGDCTISDCSNTGPVTGIVIAGSPGEASEIGGIAGVNSEYSLTGCRNTGTVCGNRNVGGVAGYLTCIDGDQTVSGCSNAGSVFGKSQTGGIVGNIDRSSIKICHNDGNVTGYASDSTSIGGIAGKIENSIQSCYNTGAVTGDSAVGGIAGTLNYVSSAYCYNTGAVTGTHSAGGIVGSGQYVTVQYGYNTGAVTSSETAGGIVGTATEYPTVRCCYSVGFISGKTSGGIGGNLSSSVQVNNNNYWGCGRGIGNMDDQSGTTEPFTALSSDSVKAAGTDPIIQSACILDAYEYESQLGTDFTVCYSTYQSDADDVAAVSGLTITGGKVGTATITGTISITQNELNMQDDSGFTGKAKTITVPVALTLTVTKATPTLTVNVSSSSAAVGDTLTLTAEINNAYDPTGTVTFYNNGTAIGSTDTISSGAASITYTPSSVDNLSVTAEYGGDANNTGALSEDTQTVTIGKRSPALSAVTAAPASPQDYPVSSVSLSATMSDYYGTLSGKTISFYNGDTYLGDALTDENGTAVYTLTKPGADTYQFAARFAGDDNHNAAETNGGTEYTVNKGTQDSLTVNGVPASVTYGDAAFKLSPSGGSGTDYTYTYKSTDENVLSVDRDGMVTITGAGSAVITVTKAGDDNYNPISTGISITVAPKTLDATITPQDKPYDATTSAAVQGIEYAGIVGSDDVYIAGGTLSFQDKTAADGKTVTASGYGLCGTKAANYVLGRLTVNQADITKISLTVTHTEINDKTYGGTTAAEFAGTPSLNGVINGDSVSLINGTPSFADKNHSDEKITVNFTGFAITGADADNYTLIQPDSVSAFINKKALTVSVSPVTIDCGQAIPTLTVNVDGFVGGESESTLKDFAKPAASQNYGSTTAPVDSAPMTVAYSGGEATNNYAFQYADTALLTIHAVYTHDSDYAVSGLYSLTENPAGWNAGDFTVTPCGDYDLISADGTVWVSALTVNTEAANGSVSFKLKKSSDGTQTESSIFYYNLDKTIPTGIISIHGSDFKSFLNKITFGLFFKDTVDVSITGSDALSGVKSIVYQKVADEADYHPDGAWTPYAPFSVSPNEKFIVYAKITDNAGNETVINSNGVVLYTDSALSADSASFDPNTAKPGYKDITVTANLSGNTVKDIQNGSYTLVKDKDYTVSGNTITFKKEYLKTAVSGTTVFLIHFNPLGETYQSGDEPAAAQFKITELVHAQVPEFQTDLSGQVTYLKGETAAGLTVNAAVSDGGTVTYQWYVSAQPDADGAPIEGAASASYTPPTDTTGVFYYYVTATNTNRAVTGDKTATAVSSMVKVAVGNLDIPAADISGDAPQTSLQGSISDIRHAVLNDDDEKNLADGSPISIYLKVRIITCPQDVRNMIASAANGSSVTKYLDISLFKRIDGVETKVGQANSPLTVTLTLPEEIRDPNRCFSVVRVHDGTATLLTDLDNDPDTITFRSDSFSDYAIVYKDTAAVTAAKTGNQYSAVPVFLLAGSLPLVLWLSSKRKRRWL